LLVVVRVLGIKVVGLVVFSQELDLALPQELHIQLQ
jgi:hypothetical protein